MFNLHPNMHHLDSATQKHEDFLGIANIMRHMTIDFHRATQ